MTDDLVKRLRETSDDWPACLVALEQEAASRIEKLEAALLDLSDGWECCPVSQAMRRVARKALDAE
jgi:hypothetical protein